MTNIHHSVIAIALPTVPTLALAVDPDTALARSALSAIETIAIPPQGAPGLSLVARGLYIALIYALEVASATDDRPAALVTRLRALLTQLETTMEQHEQSELAHALEGIKTKYPGWWMLARCSAHDHHLARLYVGLKALLALHKQSQLTTTTARRFAALLNVDDIPAHELSTVLVQSDSHLEQEWRPDLARAFSEVVRMYCDNPDPRPPTHPQRVRGQILDGVLSVSPAKRAGARDHRQLSSGQLSHAFRHISQQLEQDTLSGALGVLTSISGFTPDVVADLPLAKQGITPACMAYLDVQHGTLQVNYEALMPQAAAALSDCVPATTVFPKPLPARLADRLRYRWAAKPASLSLIELYPGETIPTGDAPVFPSRDAICPSWARWRNSCGTFLREQGMDNLLASALTGRFWHVPRSKLYYMALNLQELQHAIHAFYQLVGWGPAVPLAEGAAFGCQVVPPVESIIAHDRRLLLACQDSHPGRHGGMERLLTFHNHYMRLTAFRLSALLALRETRGIAIIADCNERLDRWLPVHDKDVPGRNFPLPMPLASFISQTIGAVRSHCRTLRGRLITLGHGKSALARWSLDVNQAQSVPLLKMAPRTPEAIHLVATRDFLSDVDSIPPDFGRKLLENALRREGLRATEIDAIMRHVTVGQDFQCSTSHVHALATWQRMTRALDRVASTCFCEVAFGLSKE